MTQEWTDNIKNEMLSSLFKMNKNNLNRCLYPAMDCDQPAIRAHSVQNARILDNLVADNHVYALTHRIEKNTGPVIDYGLVGRNAATTFTGLCAKHDSEIFLELDTEEINLDNKIHLFLLAYRAVYREYYAIINGAIKIQSAYLKRVELGLDPKDQPSAAGIFATQKMFTAWLTYRYKTDFDLAHAKGAYDDFHHDTFDFIVDRPTIAVCSLFSVDNHTVDDDYLRVALNVLPISSDRTYVVLSYREKDADHARAVLNRVITSTGMHQKYELSRLILNHSENFVISPIYFDSWSETKKKTIKDYFNSTIFEGNLEYESPELYLF